MSRKKGAKSVTPEKRREWLQRYENGESMLSIADKEDVNQRTVKHHLDIARHERELKDERSIVLRNALERHFNDLLGIVDKILTGINLGEVVRFTGDDDFLREALREHIPRSSIWGFLRRWNICIEDIAGLKVTIKGEIDSTLQSQTALKAVNSKTNGSLFKGISATLLYNIEERSQDHPGLDIDRDLKPEVNTGSLPTWNYGFAQLGGIDGNDFKTVKATLSSIEKEMEDWDRYNDLKNLYKRKTYTEKKLKEELMVLKWKRIVPGRCRLCPM